MRTIGVLGLWMVAACASTPARSVRSAEDWPRREAALSAAARPAAQSARHSSTADAPADSHTAMPSFGAEAKPEPASTDDAAAHNADSIVAGSRTPPAMANAAASAPPGTSPPGAVREDPKTRAADRKVQVAGIEGTLASFDVRVTMDAKAREFGACHAPRLRKVPSLGGDVEFKIRVLADGTVASVAVPSSNVGDRALERCFTGVILATTFPKPRGGDANVSYTMSLGVARPGREPEVWEIDRIRHIVDKRADDVRETCDLSSPRSYRATVYVNRRGKVIAAGVAGKNDQNGALDCIAEAVRKWPMPKSKKKAFAKVSFPMIGAS